MLISAIEFSKASRSSGLRFCSICLTRSSEVSSRFSCGGMTGMSTFFDCLLIMDRSPLARGKERADAFDSVGTDRSAAPPPPGDAPREVELAPGPTDLCCDEEEERPDLVSVELKVPRAVPGLELPGLPALDGGKARDPPPRDKGLPSFTSLAPPLTASNVLYITAAAAGGSEATSSNAASLADLSLSCSS